MADGTPAGSLIIWNFDAYGGGVQADVAGTMVAIDPTTGVVLSICPIKAVMDGEVAFPGVIFTLDNGKFMFQPEASVFIDAYYGAGRRTGYANFFNATPGNIDFPVSVGIIGTDYTTQGYWAGLYYDPPMGAVVQWLGVGAISPTTADAITGLGIDSVAWVGSFSPELYAIGAGTAGRLYYIKGDDIDPTLATHQLIAYDALNFAPIGVIATYAPGVVYPLSGIVQRDGSLIAFMSSTHLVHLSGVDGSVIFDYDLHTLDIRQLFPGKDDSTFWVWSGDPPFTPAVLQEFSTADGSVVNTPPLELGYTLGAAHQSFVLQVGFTGCPKLFVTGTTKPGWTLNRFDQQVRREGGNGSPPERAAGVPIEWIPDGKRWKLCRCDVSTRNEETA